MDKDMQKPTSIIAVVIMTAGLLLPACGRKGPDIPPETTPPAVVLTSPTSGTQNVAISSDIMITFSEAMDASTINEQTITLSTLGSGTVPGSVTYSDMVAVIRPASNLNPGTIYTVTVSSGVMDMVGNAMGTPYGFIFITGTTLAPTTIMINSSVVPYGANGSVTVTVSSAAGTPTGVVSLSVDGGAAMTKELIGGSTTFSIPSPSIGSHTLNATYAAQGNFGASSASGTLGVGPGETTMTLSAPGVTYNANGTVTITLSSLGGIPTGTVSLSVDSGTAITQTLAGGSTTFTIPSPNAGTHTLNAVYAAQGSFEASSASGSLIVGQAATRTTITAPVVAYGVDGSVTVTVSSTAGTPTGDVSLSVDDGAVMTLPLSNGSTTFTIPSPSFGSHALIATYAAQGNFGASLATGTLGVGPGATAMLLSAPTVTYGANGSVTVTVSSAAGTPIGNVSLRVDSGSATTQPLDISGSTTFTILSPNAGTHTLSATYTAQGIFGASTASSTMIVNQAATVTAINAPVVTYGSNGIVTVTVSSIVGTPTGTVSLRVDSGSATTQPLDISGSTTFTILSLSAGNHSLSATYLAQGNYGASSTTSTLGVAVVATTTGVFSDINPSPYGNLVTFTATVAPLAATGTVTFKDDTTSLGTGTLSGGVATFSTSALAGGVHSITAEYGGDANYSGSTSTVLSQTVNQAPTTTDVLSDINPSAYGNLVTFTATVAPLAATGTVTFKDDTTSLGTGTLSGGVATFSTSALAGGVHSITAEYGGDANYSGSTSSALSQTVDYTITATAGSHGDINPSGTVLVSPGENQSFRIWPQNTDYSIATILVDGVSIGTIPPGLYTSANPYLYQFTDVITNHQIRATFQ